MINNQLLIRRTISHANRTIDFQTVTHKSRLYYTNNIFFFIFLNFRN